MTTIKGMLDKVKDLNREWPVAIPGLVRQTSYEIEVLNKEQLFNYGRDRDGNRLMPYHPKDGSYAREKNYINPRPGLGVPDLFLTGAWYQGFTVNVKAKTFEVNSVDSKSQKLKKQYGDHIFGLTKDNIKVYALGVFYTGLQKYITLKTGLTFK